jgi:hypothetical protein
MSIDSLANQQARATWDHCASGTERAEENAITGSKELFDLMACRRYRQIDTWVPAGPDFPAMAGKRILEIGLAGLSSRFARRRPAVAHSWLEACWGWYVIAHATK